MVQVVREQAFTRLCAVYRLYDVLECCRLEGYLALSHYTTALRQRRARRVVLAPVKLRSFLSMFLCIAWKLPMPIAAADEGW